MFQRFKRMLRKGKFFYVPIKSKLLQKRKSYPYLPIIDINDLLSDKKYVGAILVTALELETNLKELYWLKICSTSIDAYYVVSRLNFSTIVDICFASNLLSMQEYRNISALRNGRNDIVHNPNIRDDYVEPKECKKIIEPCLTIIERTHDEIIVLHDKIKKKQNKNAQTNNQRKK